MRNVKIETKISFLISNFLVATAVEAVPLDSAAVLAKLAPLSSASVISALNVEAVCSDFQGPVIAWRNIALNRFAVNETETLLRDQSSVVAGGHFSLVDGSVSRGHAIAHGGMYLRNYSVGGALLGSSVDAEEGSDFGRYFLPSTTVLTDGILNEAFSFALTNPFAALNAILVQVNGNGNLEVKDPVAGTDCSHPKIFVVAATDLATAKAVRFSEACATGTILRVVGQGNGSQSLSFANIDFSLAQNITPEQVMIFVEGIEQLEIDHTVVWATVMAPNANVLFHTSRIEGALVAQNVKGNPKDFPLTSRIYCDEASAAGQINYHPFSLAGHLALP